MLVSDYYAEGRGTFSFRGVGGLRLVIYNGRCGVLLDPGMANMWRRGGERRHDSGDGRSLAVIAPCAGRGFRGCVLSLLFRYVVQFLGLGLIPNVDECMSNLLSLLSQTEINPVRNWSLEMP